MSITALIGAAAPSTALAGGAPPALPDLARALIASHTSGGQVDVTALAKEVAHISGQPGGPDPHALSDAVADELRTASQTDASAFARAEAAQAANASGASQPVTADQLRAIMPCAGAKADQYVGPLNIAMAAHGIDSREQKAAFLGQVAVESGSLHTASENLHHTSQSMIKAWPSHFWTIASTLPYLHQPAKLANHVYAGVIGNGDEASGDGFRFRGRGLIQVTGRGNYRAVGHEGDPDRLTDPSIAADTAAAHWQQAGLNQKSVSVLSRSSYDATITKTINPRELGASERWTTYTRALNTLK